MKSCLKNVLILVCTFSNILHAQRLARDPKPYNEDSLRAVLALESVDTVRAEIFSQLQESYFFKDPDSSLKYGKMTLELSRKIGYTTGILHGLRGVAEAHRQLSNFNEAMKTQFELLKLSEDIGEIDYETAANGFIGINYFALHQFDQALNRLRKAVVMSRAIDNEENRGRTVFFNIALASVYNEIDLKDSAFYYLSEAKRINPNPRYINLLVLRTFTIGDVYNRTGNKDSAKYYYKLALEYTRKSPKDVPNHISTTSHKLAMIYDLENQKDSSFYYARQAYRIGKSKRMKIRILEPSFLLSKLHRKEGRLDSALYYQDIGIVLNDSIYGRDKVSQLQVLLLDEQQRIDKIQREEERRILEVKQAEERFRNNVLLVGLLTVTAIILIASILLLRSNKIKQRTNLVLQQTLNELKATQAQLIQSEKMASLGELTAGIAHEIQNPLNFVNNFSELNKELIEELDQKAKQGKLEDVQKLVTDIKLNEEKIEHHGKRADAIVKSMLQHSRSSSGQKEPTDINVLCDEYLRLAFHGFRAKDKSFSAKFETHHDPAIPRVKIVAQEIGRVVLNLVNNAFYAVNEKSKKNIDGYEPCVKLITKNHKNLIEIRVSDNGNGIPSSIREKIFQPFFTTKPTGQGTGLGLSLAYDIITKAHGGELKFETTEGAGSEFIILLPLSKNT